MITVEKLTKCYGRRFALRDVSFEVNRGEIFGILGPNGAGKSTAMKVMASCIPPTSGSVRIIGYDTVTDSLQARKYIGYVPEDAPSYSDMDVEQFLNFVARIKGVKAGNVLAQVEGTMIDLGLIEVRDRIIGTLSRGYQQMVGFAQALINDPQVLILDEPMLGLDKEKRLKIDQLIRELSGWRTVILSSSSFSWASELCNRVAFLHKGMIAAIDSVQSFITRYRTRARISITVGERAEEVMRAFGSIEGILTVSSPAPNVIEVESVLDRDLLPVLTEKVVKLGIPLLEATRKETGLEEVFTDLTTGEAGGIA